MHILHISFSSPPAFSSWHLTPPSYFGSFPWSGTEIRGVNEKSGFSSRIFCQFGFHSCPRYPEQYHWNQIFTFWFSARSLLFCASTRSVSAWFKHICYRTLSACIFLRRAWRGTSPQVRFRESQRGSGRWWWPRHWWCLIMRLNLLTNLTSISLSRSSSLSFSSFFSFLLEDILIPGQTFIIFGAKILVFVSSHIPITPWPNRWTVRIALEKGQ